ncbi:DUF1223 domain-containing protein [Allorhizobium sonneratiae]|uniref:DUF1223 domain-containing protein n=1 Tax=Allorhizobium sonneratiae TaxID=2934936 RepID=UPI0020344594|nr:DUF1223 domain-containing protein [Allorhizobium sonneratiae]
MVKRLVTFLIVLMAALPAMAEDMSPAAGTTPSGVIELFTSQGCISCPPADKVFESLAKNPALVALSYHVDYWNYRGWRDTLGSSGNTARQYAYARSFGRSGVYTPQAVVNGQMQMKGTDAAHLSGELNTLKQQGNGLTVKVSAAIKGDEVLINLGSGSGKADVVVVYFTRKKDVDVLKGENKGKHLTYWNSVKDIQSVGLWRGADMHLTLPSKVLRTEDCDGFAVLLQTSDANGDPGKILGATMVMAPQANQPQNGLINASATSDTDE